MFAYHLCTFIGLCAAVLAYRFLGFPKRTQDQGVLIAGIFSLIIGAKIPVWIAYGFSPDLISSGKSFMGAVLGAFLGINLYKYLTHQADKNFGDGFVIPLAIAAGFGKIGCFLYGCCAGKETGWVLMPYYPVQLIESIFQFAAAFLLWRFYKKGHSEGLLFPLYITGYLVMRFFVEFLRTEPVSVFGLTVYQILVLVFVPVFIFILNKRGFHAARHSQIG